MTKQPDGDVVIVLIWDGECLNPSEIRRVELNNIVRMFPHPIGDSIWLAKGSLLVGAGHHLCLFGQPRRIEGEHRDESLFEYVAGQNGPLEDYHPQMMLQCLLWGKILARLVVRSDVCACHRESRTREAGHHQPS